MILYRLAKTAYVHDLSGAGSRIHGGRWTLPGTSAVYTSQNRSLAVLEFYVHTNPRFIPVDLSLAKIEVPDGSGIESLSFTDLPQDWQAYPAPVTLQDYGYQWVNSGKTLLLKVPSVQVRYEFNYLINCRHPDMPGVKIVNAEQFSYDRRITKR